MLTSGYFPCHGSSLIQLDHALPDTYNDVLGEKIKRIQEIGSWTSE